MSQHIKYNVAFDHVIEALVAARTGNIDLAATSLLAAANAPDAKEATAILETNNKAAYARAQRALKAKASRGRVRAEVDFEDEEGEDEEVFLDDVFEDDIDVGVEAEIEEVVVEDFDDEEGDVVVEARRRGRRATAGRRGSNPLAAALRRHARR